MSEDSIVVFSQLPQLSYSDADFLLDFANCPEERLMENGFKHKLLESWAHAAEKGVFNYELVSSKFRALDGRYQISVQLNPDRCNKRRKPHQFQSICQPFDPDSWNFTKLKAEECLFRLNSTRDKSNESANETSVLAVNASPLSAGHCLLIPSPGQCLSQQLTLDAVQLSIELILLVEDNRLVFIYNSLLAHASVNHLHLQALFWPNRSGVMAIKLIATATNVPALFLMQRPHWYVPAFVFQLTNLQQIGDVARNIAKTAQFLADKGVAHNLFICRSARICRSEMEEGKAGAEHIEKMDAEEAFGEEEEGEQLVTLFMFPRRTSQEGLDQSGPFASSFVPAALELAGLLPVYDPNFFDFVTEEEVLRLFEQHQLMADADFQLLADQLVRHLCAEE